MRLYIDNLEPIDLPNEWFERLQEAGHIVLGLNDEPRLEPTMAELVFEARCLRSEHGENPEYDRALVELIHHVGGYDSNDADYSLIRELVLS